MTTTYYRLVDAQGDSISVTFTPDDVIRQAKNSGDAIVVIDVVVPGIDETPKRAADVDPTFELLDADKLTPEAVAEEKSVVSPVPAQEKAAYEALHPEKRPEEEQPGSKDFMAIPDLPPTPEPVITDVFTGSIQPTPIYVERQDAPVVLEPEIESDLGEEVEREPITVTDPAPAKKTDEAQEAVDRGEPFVPQPAEEPKAVVDEPIEPGQTEQRASEEEIAKPVPDVLPDEREQERVEEPKADGAIEPPVSPLEVDAQPDATHEVQDHEVEEVQPPKEETFFTVEDKPAEEPVTGSI